jgi:hypothetical protein
MKTRTKLFPVELQKACSLVFTTFMACTLLCVIRKIYNGTVYTTIILKGIVPILSLSELLLGIFSHYISFVSISCFIVPKNKQQNNFPC